METFKKTSGNPRVILLLLWLISSAGTLALGTEYYVDAAGGDDANDGSIGAPWQSFMGSLDRLSAGDTLHVRDAATFVAAGNAILDAANTGQEGAPITVKAYPEESPVIDLGTNAKAIKLFGANYWTFEGLEFTGSDTNTKTMLVLGSHVDVGGSETIKTMNVILKDCLFRDNAEEALYAPCVEDITIDGCRFSDIRSGVLGEDAHGLLFPCWLERVTIRNCLFEEIGSVCVFIGSAAGGAGGHVGEFLLLGNRFWVNAPLPDPPPFTRPFSDCGEGGVLVKHATGPWAIRGNVFHGYRVASPATQDCAGGSYGQAILIKQESRDGVIERNTVFDCNRGVEIEGDYTAGDLIIRNNLILDSLDRSLSIRNADLVRVLNNTVRNDTAPSYNFYGRNATNCVLKNNVSYNGEADSNDLGWTADYNVWGAYDVVDSNLQGANDLYITDVASNFSREGRPRSGCEFLDNGEALSEVVHDLDGETRDATPDRGAFERGAFARVVDDAEDYAGHEGVPSMSNGWSESFAVDGFHEGSLWTAGTGREFVWETELQADGQYAWYARASALKSGLNDYHVRNTAARYRLAFQGASEIASMNVDQNVDPGRWSFLGAHELDADWHEISVMHEAVGDPTVADAVRLVRLAPQAPVDNRAVIWDAEEQTDSTDWQDSSWSNRSMRCLIQGDDIRAGGNYIRLTIPGRTSGDYTINKVSLIQREAPGTLRGIDSTFTRVTFGDTWEAGVTVPAGQDVVSDLIPFSIDPGEDYFFTFHIPTIPYPTVFLRAPYGHGDYTWIGDSNLDMADQYDWDITSPDIVATRRFIFNLADIEVLTEPTDNHAPVWTPNEGSNLRMSDGEVLYYYSDDVAPHCSDPDGDPVTFSKTNGPSWLQVNSDGTIDTTGDLLKAADVGDHSFTIRATDNHNAWAEITVKINIDELHGPGPGVTPVVLDFDPCDGSWCGWLLIQAEDWHEKRGFVQANIPVDDNHKALGANEVSMSDPTPLVGDPDMDAKPLQELVYYLDIRQSGNYRVRGIVRGSDESTERVYDEEGHCNIYLNDEGFGTLYESSPFYYQRWVWSSALDSVSSPGIYSLRFRENDEGFQIDAFIITRAEDD